MSAQSLAVIGTGLVTSVGLSAPAACAAIRSGLTNPAETRFIDSLGEWIMSHSVPLEEPVGGMSRLAFIAAMSAQEALSGVDRDEWPNIPLLLCVAERARPGRLDGLEDGLLPQICSALGGARFAEASLVVPHGRVSVGAALLHARRFIHELKSPAVLIVATDSLVAWPTLRVLKEHSRLLAEENSNGFIPGEAASAILVARAAAGPGLYVMGLGFSSEKATIETDEPLRADGLRRAIFDSLREAGCEMHDMDFRITDLSGEHYYFKEATLALSRTMRRVKEEFDIWHPAECIGEVGSAIGPAMLIVAEAAARKSYAPGPTILLHASNDGGQRLAIVARYMES